jgi:hypothetical protein
MQNMRRKAAARARLEDLRFWSGAAGATGARRGAPGGTLSLRALRTWVFGKRAAS